MKGKAWITLTTIGLIPLSGVLNIASAQTMENEEYILDLNPTKVAASPSLTPIPTDSPKGSVESSHNTSLSLQVNPTQIQYGELHPGEAIIRVAEIAAGGSKFDVLMYQIGNLASSTNEVIADTTCDEGTCTELVSARWKSPLTYGFGYRIDSNQPCVNKDECRGSFKADYFKQFPNLELKEFPQSVLHSSSSQSASGKLSFKVNIPATLQNKDFYNTIHLIALPRLED